MLLCRDHVEVEEYGDAGLLVTFRHDDPEDRWQAGQTLQAALFAHQDSGIVDVVAAFDTAFVSFDPAITDHGVVTDLIADGNDQPGISHVPALFAVPTVYDGERGPDLSAVAQELGVTPAKVVQLHTSRPWTVRFRGSPVALPMMDGPTMPASISRSPVPRTHVTPGSVALSGQQCLIYPVVSPGGWRLIGQTPVRLFDLTEDELVAYRPGDQLQFRAISEDAWDQWADRPLVPESRTVSRP